MADDPEIVPDPGEIRVGMRVPDADAEDSAEFVDEAERERIRELIQQTLEEEEAKHPTPRTPEEAEHQALEDVFADIRHESHYGRLVTREHWEAEGFVPEHLDADTFAGLVFGTLAGTLDEDAQGAEVEQAAESEKAGTPKTNVEEAEAEAEPEAEEPENPDDAATGEDAETETPQLAPLVFDDIIVMEGAKAKYLYSNREMTDAFAKWSFLAAEDDKVATFVSTVREESETYPRPMREISLTHDPFDMSVEEIRSTWDIVRESGDYPDIETCTASNGDVYYYSTKFLEDAQAEALAEYYSVRRFMSP